MARVCNHCGVGGSRGAIGSQDSFSNFQDLLIGVSLGEAMVSRIAATRKYPEAWDSRQGVDGLLRPLPHGFIRQAIRLSVVFAGDVRDGKPKSTGQLPASPVQ